MPVVVGVSEEAGLTPFQAVEQLTGVVPSAALTLNVSPARAVTLGWVIVTVVIVPAAVTAA